MRPSATVKIAVSACLLGIPCRHDGGHKRDAFITQELGRWFELLPFCPEELAFGTPRESMSLWRIGSKVRLIGNITKKDMTQTLETVCKKEADRIAASSPVAAIFKSKSPSCGLKGVKLYLHENKPPILAARGFFARALLKRLPGLLATEEIDLQDPFEQKIFLMTLFAYCDLSEFLQGSPDTKDLATFHQNHTFLLLCKSAGNTAKLGQIVANSQKRPFAEVLQNYRNLFLKTVAFPASSANCRNAFGPLFDATAKSTPTN